MSNPYFNATGVPQAETRGSSSSIRTEFLAVQAGFEGINTALLARGRIAGQAWTGTHDFSGGTLRAAAPVSGSDAATKSYVESVSFSSALPATPAGAGPYTISAAAGVVGWALSAPFSNSAQLAQAHAIILSF